jgi:hypothetical protein
VERWPTWDKKRVDLLGSSGAELLDALTEAKTEVQRVPSVLGPFWTNPWHIALLTLGALLVPVVALLLDAASLPPGLGPGRPGELDTRRQHRASSGDELDA